MKTKTVVLIALAICMVSTATATTISQEDIIIDLEDNSVATEIDVDTLTTTNFNYQTAHPVQNLEVWFNGEKKQCSVNELTVGSEINCETDMDTNFSVRLEYETSGIVSSQNNIRTFTYSQSIYRPIMNYSMRVILPEGTGLVDSANITTPVIQPEGAELGNMNGRRFYVEWNTNPELGETVMFQMIFEDLEDSPGNSILPVILALVLVVGIVFVVYRRKSQVEASSILDELDEDERMVVELLRENGGGMLQKDIVQDSDYSKAKISGVVGSLEETGIVSKEKEGRSNKVRLENQFTG
jgi:uncharacterized membrane protein